MKLFSHLQKPRRSAAARRPSAGRHVFQPKSADMSAHSKGIALIVTLIMLSVITFLTVTFLVLSQRELTSVTTSTDQLIAKQTADAGLERAKIELLAPMLRLTNGQVYGLMVSTNFIQPGPYFSDPLQQGANGYTNVSYIMPGGSTVDTLRGMLTNLLYNPRAPVFVTNRLTGQTEFRYYLDLNRNGRFDTNGYLPVMDTNGLPVFLAPQVVLTNFFVGDPEWIGVLERPDQPHSSSNRFIARYAYLVAPAGKTLDVNFVHNQAKRLNNEANSEGFSRNQGVGAYEINLGAFFTDLNPRFWNLTQFGNDYFYNPTNIIANRGAGFDDAFAILRYRYNYAPITNAARHFPNGAVALQRDGIDQYADGPMMLGTGMQRELPPHEDVIGKQWAGSDQPNAYFSIQEFFDRNRTPGLTDRLLAAGTNLSSFDRYTYYRMLEQLGTDSETDHRMNLNYVNVNERMEVVPGLETRQIPWTNAVQFFTNAADRLLRAQFPRGYLGVTNICVTNIPIILSNEFVYSPSIHRALQLAANLFEATTNAPYPRIFRPYFDDAMENGFRNFYVRGFEEVVNPVYFGPNNPSEPIDLELIPEGENFDITFRPNVYGVPWIIGARKGLPNFNEVTLASRMNATRRIVARRPSMTASPSQYTFQEQFMMDLWCELGVEVWNSYHGSNFPGAQVHVTGDFSFALTNAGAPNLIRGKLDVQRSVTTNNWPGYAPTYGPAVLPRPDSFIVPLRTNILIVTNMVYDPDSRSFTPNPNAFFPMRPNSHQFGFTVTNRLRVVITDAAGRIIDYVQLRGPNDHRWLSEEIRTDGQTGFQGLWNTNLAANVSPPMTRGQNNQLLISQGTPESSDAEWHEYGINIFPGSSRLAEVAEFKAFMLGARATVGGVTAQNPTNLVMQAPFTPTRAITRAITWQANDPLVHYIGEDLVDIAREITNNIINPPSRGTNLLDNIGILNERYEPWGGNPMKLAGDPNAAANDAFANNFTIKDPGISASIFWGFPTNKLPNAGWMGRVHRGTPWQSVYMKAYDALRPDGYHTNLQSLAQWSRWSGHRWIEDMLMSAPVNDRMLFDLFTVTPNENAARGRLPITQTNLAAWSAVLSGVWTFSNDVNGVVTPWKIEPAAVSQEVNRIVAGITRTKSMLVTNNGDVFPFFPDGEFARLGDILAVPELTEASPYLNTNLIKQTTAGGLNDAIMERIPQQIMSLLSHPQSPRFVIYSYGQSLRPANQAIVRAFGAFRGMATNYQVTAESAVRAVVRVDGSFDPQDQYHPLPERRYPPRLVIESYNPLPPD